MPDGRMLLSERNGIVSVIHPRGAPAVRWITLPVASTGAGLLGLALAPDHERSGAVFAVGSFFRDPPRDSTLENRVYRLRDSAGTGVVERLVLGRLPSARSHAGGAIAFGPDGRLYVTLGDAFVPGSAAHPDSLAGKILRLDPDGGVPDDNPFPGSPVYALGLRNPQGLAWEPSTGALFAPDHGPTDWPWEGGRRDHDELNEIRPGADYGWPSAAGRSEAGSAQPLVDWTPAIAPSGAAFYTGDRFPEWKGNLFVGALAGQALHRLVLDGEKVVGEEKLLAELGERIRDVRNGPDGALWLLTDSPEGRVLRVVPR
jgi:glucose/arabinose dehydrogenase